MLKNLKFVLILTIYGLIFGAAALFVLPQHVLLSSGGGILFGFVSWSLVG